MVHRWLRQGARSLLRVLETFHDKEAEVQPGVLSIRGQGIHKARCFHVVEEWDLKHRGQGFVNFGLLSIISQQNYWPYWPSSTKFDRRLGLKDTRYQQQVCETHELAARDSPGCMQGWSRYCLMLKREIKQEKQWEREDTSSQDWDEGL